MRKEKITALKKTLICILFVVTSLSLVSCKSSDYQRAEELYKKKDYESALEIYLALGNYEDAEEKKKECNYYIAQSQYDQKLYDEASQIYKELGDYRDSEDKLKLCEKEIGMHSNADYDFLSDIEKSILERMEQLDSPDRAKLVNTELVYLEKYSDSDFYDKELKELADQYIEGLHLQQKALGEEYFSDYQIEWQRGIVSRFGVLKQLNEKYNLLSDNNGFIAEYVVGYEAQKKLLDAYEAIDQDVYEQTHNEDGNINVEYEYYNSNSGKCYFTVKNNTDYTYSTIYKADFYDDNNVVFYSSDCYIDSIKPGNSYVVTFYIDFTHCTTDHYSFDWYNYYDDVKLPQE